MRIVLVNWARIWDGASYGGGVNQYCQALAIELLRNGHEVISLFGGTTFVRDHSTGKVGKCHIRRHDDWLTEFKNAGGIKVFEVVNSPVMAPSIVQYEDPLGEVSAPELEHQVAKLMTALAPDVIHWNNIEGFSVGCIDAIRAVCKARHIFSLHNYHTICPQVYLMQGHRKTCYDFDNGHACATCIEVKPRDAERERHMLAYDKSKGVDPHAVGHARHAWLGALGTLKRTVWGLWEIRQARARQDRIKRELHAPGTLVDFDRPATVRDPHPPAGGDRSDQRGKTPHLLAELNPWTPPPPDAPELQPLTNSIEPPTPIAPSVRSPNDYARRRAAMVAMLSSCDRVLAVSDFVRRKFVSMGVDERVIRTMPIGSRINRVIALKPDLVFDPPPPETGIPWHRQRPLRLHFMGYNNYYKGLHVVADALEMLDPAHLRQIDLSIFALEGHRIEWMFRRLEPRLARLTFRGEYNYHDIPWMLGGKDLTLVPSVWWDNAPQTVFESMACGVPVLGADIGGIPDFVRHRHNGLLFTANSRPALRHALIEAIEDPHLVWSLRANVAPPKSIEEHAREIIPVYQGSEPPSYVPPASDVECRIHGKRISSPAHHVN